MEEADFVARVRIELMDYMKNKKVKPSQVAIKAGLAPSIVTRWLHRETEISSKNIMKIIKVIKDD